MAPPPPQRTSLPVLPASAPARAAEPAPGIPLPPMRPRSLAAAPALELPAAALAAKALEAAPNALAETLETAPGSPAEAPETASGPAAKPAAEPAPNATAAWDRAVEGWARDAVPVPAAADPAPAGPLPAETPGEATGAPSGPAPRLALAPPPRPALMRPAPAGPTGSGKPGMVCRDPRVIGRRKPLISHAAMPCGIAEPVLVETIDGIALRPAATLGCGTARALADWVSGVLRPATRRHLQDSPTALRIFGAYACRTRNNRKGARISEHARGRAIDIGAVLLAGGGRVSVKEHWGKGARGALLKAARKGACGRFTTVLGPGSDRHHADHFHFDTAQRRTTWCK
ncbi:extensin-like domain-containing protein [Paralimibaculum aggregatum]|uniref:extensin-like domain-containing protein n=1 Tax=Paralimibaculum aggregatum TaxID=3036245 RepID=UPI002553C98A|nr:extensin family protein [Limibaculum sp. NKW23]